MEHLYFIFLVSKYFYFRGLCMREGEKRGEGESERERRSVCVVCRR